MAIIYNTLRLKAEFKTFDDEYGNPTGITLRVYDTHRIQIGDTIDIGDSEKLSTGIYQYDYLLPVGYTAVVYEFSGVLEDEIITGRSTIKCDWT